MLVWYFLPFQTFAYDFSFQKGDNLLQIDFEGNQVKEIKFDLKINDGIKFNFNDFIAKLCAISGSSLKIKDLKFENII